MIAVLIFIVSLGIQGAFWRAVFVAALALITFALARYWRGLSEYSKQTRYLLVGLRAVSLLLVALVFVGARLEYRTQTPLRLLIHRSETRPAKDESKRAHEAAVIKRLNAFSSGKHIELVEKVDVIDMTGSNSKSGNLVAAIFLTDGALRAADAADEIRKANVASDAGPVFVVTDFQDDDGPRVALESVVVTNRPVLGVPLLVRCVIHSRGMRGRTTLITISDDAQVRASGQVRWFGDDERQVVTLEVVPKTAGWINYLVRAEAARGEDTGELSSPIAIYAEDRRQRVLFLEGEPTWEAKFIRRALDSAGLFDVDYFAQVSRAAIAGIKDEQADEGRESTGTTDKGARTSPDAKLRTVLSTATRLNAYDCIIVGATPDAMLSKSEATRLRDWVERRGGGLVILGGNNFAGSIVDSKGKLGSLMPAFVDSSAIRSTSQTLALGAPVEAEKSRVGIMLTPTNAGVASALLAYSNAVTGNKSSNALSGEGMRIGALRPGTAVLAVTGQPGENGTSEVGAPLIVTMRYGAGRALLFGPNDSWRMRTSESGDQIENAGPFASLWQGLVLWAASSSRPPVEIVMSDDSPAAGSEATVELVVRDDVYVPQTIEKVSADLQPVSETGDQTSEDVQATQEIAFVPDRNDVGIWRARFTAPPPGRFDLQIKFTANGKAGSAEKYFATVTPSLIEPGASRDTLRRVARQTGGDVFDEKTLAVLFDRLAALPQTKQEVNRSLEVRSLWTLALIIPLLLSCEWLIARIKAKGDLRHTLSSSRRRLATL